MKKGFLLGLTIIGVLFLLVLLAPWLISLNQYKTMIQQKAYDATGRELVIEGDVRLGLLPAPYARLTDVMIKNPAGTLSKEFARIKVIDVGVALQPLLSKRIQITHITISEPAINLETLANGSNNWQFKPVEKTPEQKAVEDSSSSEQSALSIDDLSIEKAYIRIINDKEKGQQVVGPMNAKFQISSLQGPINGTGDITVMGKLPIHFETAITSLPADPNGAIPFTLAMNLLGNAASANLKGTLQKGDTPSARVETAIAIPNLDQLLATISKDNKAPALPIWMKGKMAFNGLMTWKDKQAKIDNLMIRSGGMEIDGSLDVDTKDKTAVTLDLTHFSLPPDEETVPVAAGPAGKPGAQKNLAQTLADAFAGMTGFLDTTLPTSPLNVVVTASQMTLPQHPVMRDVRLAASVDATGVTIQNAEMKLPGNTQVKASGTLPARQDGKIDTIKLNTMITTQDMQAALGNSDEGGAATPINLQATTTITRNDLHIQPLQITQNGQTVLGDVIYNPKADTALSIALKGSALDLDALLGKKNTKAAASAPSKADGAPTAPANSDPFAKLQGLKAKITADLASVTYQNKTAKQVAVQSMISDKGLELTQAQIGDLGGMVITANGRIDRLSPLSGVALNAQAKTPNLSNTLKALGNADAANLGASEFTAQVNGDAQALKVGLNGTIDQGKLAINGTAKDLNTSPGFTGTIDMSHPETATILRNFAKMTPKVNLGAFALKTNLTYGGDTLKADNLLVQMGSAGTLQGHVNIVPQNGGRSIDADLKADKLALAAMMGDDTETSAAAVNTTTSNPVSEGWSNDPVNLDSFRDLNGKANLQVGELLYKKFVIRNLQTTLSFANNTINLQQLRGGLFDAGTFNISGQLAPGKQGQAHRGDFSIGVDKTDAAKLFAALGSKPFSKGTLDLTQKISFNGASPAAIISSLNGDGEFKVTDGVINGIDLDALAAKLDRPNSLTDFAAIIDQARAGGETNIGNLTMPITIRSGVVTVPNTPIKTQKTAMSLQGTVNLPTKQVDMSGQIQFVEQRNLPALTLLVKGPMNNPQKSFDTRSFTSFYAQKATEKLQQKAVDKLGKILGLPKSDTATPTAPTEPAAPAPVATPPANGGVATPTAPVSPAAPGAAAAPAQKKQDIMKQLGNQMLNNLLNGSKQ